jgi:hypothetical protein
MELAIDYEIYIVPVKNRQYMNLPSTYLFLSLLCNTCDIQTKGGETYMKEVLKKVLTDKKARSAKAAKKAALSSTAYVPWSGL